MTEHEELVAEMAVVEKMATQERLKHARKRRMQQLKRWTQREKELAAAKNRGRGGGQTRNNNDYKVHFVPSVMLLEAAARNDIEEVRRLLMLGVSPDSTNEDGLTALHQCCIDASEGMVRLLLEFGADVNAKDSEQWTPLHAAATCGHLHLVKYLIAKGAELLAVNADGNMPYDICEDEATLDYIETEMAKRGITQQLIDETRAATEHQMLADLKQLQAEGQDLDLRDEQGATPLHIAAANGYVSVVEFLLDNNVSLDAADVDQWQPIHAAACWGHPEVIELLVQAGASLNARTKNGETPYDICEDPDLKERIIQLQNEMETKRGSQPNKLRRSQSQNTRSQSIRRTSIRDKSLMSRREAREEAKLRHEKPSEEDDELKVQHDAAEREGPVINLHDIEVALSPISSKDTLQRIKGKVAALEESCRQSLAAAVASESPSLAAAGAGDLTAPVTESPQESINPASSKGELASKHGGEPSASHSPSSQQQQQQQQNESVKVEIHVTVNTSPTYSASNGTLAELKKHRADMRNRGSLSLSPSPPDGTMFSSRNGHHFSATYTYAPPPPSPTVSLKRFRSDPSEIVGEPQKHGCCTLM